MKRIVISGYYGFGNTGDEAVLSGICATLDQIGVQAEVTVLTSDPARTLREHPGVRAVGRSSWCRQLWAMMRADLFISGGGSLFQDSTSVLSPYYYLAVLNLARALRCKTMVYAQGVGPLIRPGIRKGVAKAFNKADAITVRDADSTALLREIGVTREVRLSADPAFMIEPDLEAADRILSEAGLAGRPLIGISLRPWPGQDEWLASAAHSLAALGEELGAAVAFIPMKEPDDAAVGDEGIVLRHGGDPRIAKGLIARCEMVVGMRLHSLIFAAGAGVPFVPLVYDPKVSSFSAEADQPAGVEVGDPDPDALVEAVRQAWGERQALAGRLSEKTAEFRRLAAISGEIAAEL